MLTMIVEDTQKREVSIVEVPLVTKPDLVSPPVPALIPFSVPWPEEL